MPSRVPDYRQDIVRHTLVKRGVFFKNITMQMYLLMTLLVLGLHLVLAW